LAVALIVAAGCGERLGADGPKALVELAGRTMLQWSVDALRAVPAIEQIIVALPAGADAPAGTSGVEGGSVRSESVRLALAAAGGGRDRDLVLVHDAARPPSSRGQRFARWKRIRASTGRSPPRR